MEKAIIEYTLSTIDVMPGRLMKKDITKRILEHYKKLRAENNVKGAAAKNLNLHVYEKTGITVSSILEYIQEHNWIEMLDDDHFQLTGEGINHLNNIYTNNFSSEFETYKQQVKQLADQYEEPNFGERHVMRMFWYKRTLDYIKNSYFTRHRYADGNHPAYQKVMGLQIPEGSMALHIRPTLFLDLEDLNESVQLEIEGIEVPAFELKKPFPNKRYVIARLKGINDENLNSFGFYAYIKKNEDFPNTQKITYRWYIGEDKVVEHHLNICFAPKYGNIYSTMQRTSRTSEIPTRAIITKSGIEDLMKYTKAHKGDIKLRFDLNSESLTIKENVTLVSIPMHLHFVL